MRLITPAGLAIRAVLAAAISVAVLAGSLASIVTLAVVGGMILSAYASDLLEFAHVAPPTAVWPVVWSLCALGASGWFTRAIRSAIRTERAELLQRTTTLSEATVDERSAIDDAVTRFAKQANLPKPPIRVDPTATPLAYTTHRPDDPVVRTDDAVTPTIVISQGLIETLSESELSAVLAHELAHIANDDLRLITMVLVPLIAAETLAADEGSTSNLFELCGCLLGFVASIGVGVFSRGRELAADRGAVAITGDPATLAAALERLDGAGPGKPTTDLRDHARSTNAINILPTLSPGRDTTDLCSTHPPLETRLEQLRTLAAD